MSISGLGQDGYLRVQKETVYGTAVYNDMVFIPAKSGSNFVSSIQDIENANIIASRLKQVPNMGREVNTFEIQTDVYPDQIGLIMSMFLGVSSDANSTNSTHIHTWLLPISGMNIASSFTMEIAKGGDTATRLAGCVINSIKLNCDNKGNIALTLSGVAQSYVDGISRATVFAYPTSSPFNFGMTTLSLTPSGGTQFVQGCDSIDIECELGYNLEDFKTGSTRIVNPQFSSIPKLTLKAKIDADKKFVDGAKAHTMYSATLAIESVAYAGGTTTFKTEFELPAGKLKPETSIPYENDRLTMDLDFDFGFGGITTGSQSSKVMGEVRVRDTEASYA